ncbi:MAG: hypothetical protein IPM66_00995 [Acidobacteriota bacterium]|nr:MAG: hypothetical protein IPM66_00995 [Acidobacteriota bacterium]
MAEIVLTQTEADALIAMEKHRVDDMRYDFPMGGESVSIQLQSADRRENFMLDLSRGRIDFLKVKMQNRGRQVVVLVRLDLGGAPHRNPDDEEIPAPHLHIYREGYGDKWAIPVPAEQFRDPDDAWITLEDFLRYCNVTKPPYIEKGLFT